MQKLVRISKFSATDWQMALEALITVTMVRLVLILWPFPNAMDRLGLRLGCSGDADDCQIASAQIDAIGTAISRACKVAPLKAVCLQQAVTAAIMLRRRRVGVEIHFGVGKNSLGEMTAHAWSVSGGIVITGKRGIDDVVPISVFVT